MSGFIAIVNTNGAPVDRELLEKLTASLRFKGPDRQQVWIDGPVGLCHTLFRTTAEAQYENQPASLDNKVWITGCIRIDGRKELVNELGMGKEIKLNQTPDSELVLHAYHTWGENFLEHLLGDFSFVLWDNVQRKLYCGIDRFAMRQLYYSHAGSTFVVSNSMHCMRQHPVVSGRLNDEAIGDFLLFGDHRWVDKTQTTFSDIRTLQPAHYLVLENEATRSHRYWDIPVGVSLLRYRREQEYLDHFQDTFKTVVSDRLRTSEVVISLSGGMDSSSIAACVRKIQREDNLSIDLNAVTVLYDSILPSDERYYVDLVAHNLKLLPHYLDGGQYPLLSPPILTTRPLELYQPALWLDLDRAGSALGRVMLTGEAGDNLMVFSSVLQSLKEATPLAVLLGIYHLRKLYGVFPGFGTGLLVKLKRLQGLSDKNGATPYPCPDWINPEFEAKIQLKERWRERWSRKWSSAHPRHHRLHESLIEPDWNTDDIYMHSDFTLPEKRDPFLDLRLLEFVQSLPSLPWLFNKHLLRRSMAGKLPAEVLKRPKIPLGSFHDSLLEQPGMNWVNEWCPVPVLSGFIDRTKVPSLTQGDCKGNQSYINIRPLVLNSWLKALTQ